MVSVFRTGLDKGEAESYKAEHTKFGELCVSSEAKGLMSLFHGQVNWSSSSIDHSFLGCEIERAEIYEYKKIKSISKE